MNKDMNQRLEDLEESIKNLSEKQSTHYTDIMIALRRIEDKLESSETETRSYDELYEVAKKLVIKNKKASTSWLQRKLGIGYSRAASLLDKLEADGIVSKNDGTRMRKVLVEG